MAVVITVADVKDGFTTSLPDAQVQILIDFVSGADACLDGSRVPDATQKALKTIAVRHMCVMQAGNGAGQVRSKTAPNGASVSFSSSSGGSQYGDLLSQMDVTGCVSGLLENNKPSLYFAAVGS